MMGSTVMLFDSGKKESLLNFLIAWIFIIFFILLITIKYQKSLNNIKVSKEEVLKIMEPRDTNLKIIKIL